MTNSQEVTKASLKALVLTDESSKRDTISGMTFTPEESFSKIKVLPVREIVDIKSKGEQVVTFVNSLGHKRVQLVSVLVNSVNVMVSIIIVCTEQHFRLVLPNHEVVVCLLYLADSFGCKVVSLYTYCRLKIHPTTL